MALVRSVYLLTRNFPREEVYGLTGQMRRAAVSVPSNIAEGQAREHLREYLHHLSMAQGSLAELETQLELAVQLEFVSIDDGDPVIDEAAIVARQLRALRVALDQRLATAERSPNPRNLKPETQSLVNGTDA
jgi:four helix bundle protein